MAYVDEGDPENPPVVFLHGFPTSSYLWREFVPQFAPWMRAIAPDLIGYGDSDKPEAADLSLRAHADRVRELLDALGIDTFAVVGHSTGGGVAQLLALSGRVGAMVLIDSVAFDAWPSENTRDLQRSATDEVAVTATEAHVRAVLRVAFEMGMTRRARLTEELLAEYARPWEGGAGVAAFVRALRSIDGVGLAGIEGQLGGLECPTLILWGEEDPFHPFEVAERLNDAMPASSLAVLPGCSHFLPEDAPETIVPLMFEYLRSRYLGRPHTHGAEGAVPVTLERRPPDRR
jgi:pimeloyl-ACP methyl ester carboxylesterase